MAAEALTYVVGQWSLCKTILFLHNLHFFSFVGNTSVFFFFHKHKSLQVCIVLSGGGCDKY